MHKKVSLPILPVRYENISIEKFDDKNIRSLIFKNDDAITHINNVIENMQVSNSGAFLILKGESGIGKTTFLHTLNLYIENIEIHAINDEDDINRPLKKLPSNNKIKIIILENRESIEEVKNIKVENDLTAINKFIRTDLGRKSIIVWPCNGKDVLEDICEVANRIGGTSLLGVDSVYEFFGPKHEFYYKIVKKTFSICNNGQEIENYGINKELSDTIMQEKGANITIGYHLSTVKDIIVESMRQINKNFDYNADSFKLWIVVISSSDCRSYIDYLTKGSNRKVDLDRIINSTNSNVKRKALDHIIKLKMFAELVDFKILYLNIEDACAVIKSTEEEKLLKILSEKNIKNVSNNNIKYVIDNLEISKCIKEQYINLNNRRMNEIGTDAKVLMEISQSNDKLLNQEICKKLKEYNYIYSFEPENSLDDFTRIRSDAHCGIEGDYLELEFMWRTQACNADIASYSLNKLYNYAEALRIFN